MPLGVPLMLMGTLRPTEGSTWSKWHLVPSPLWGEKESQRGGLSEAAEGEGRVARMESGCVVLQTFPQHTQLSAGSVQRAWDPHEVPALRV